MDQGEVDVGDSGALCIRLKGLLNLFCDYDMSILWLVQVSVAEDY